MLLIIVGAIIRPGVFLTSDNLLNVLTQASITGIIAIGMTFVIATGGIDLSVGSGAGRGQHRRRAVEPSMAPGCSCSAPSAWHCSSARSTALAITWGKVVPFIATLAMLIIARGLALWMSEKTPISLIELDILQSFGSGRVLGVPVPALIFVAVTIAGWVLLNRTTFGRRAIAVGGNRSAARIAGIRPGRVIFAVYVLTGLCVGISAILLSGRLASASPVVGNLVELDAIAAVVIGGTALTGGKATVTGTFFGVITFGLIFNLLNLLNMPNEIQGIVKGALILAAVALQRRD